MYIRQKVLHHNYHDISDSSPAISVKQQCMLFFPPTADKQSCGRYRAGYEWR